MDQNKPLLDGVILWMSAISLFIFGHIIEGNLRAMTVIIIYPFYRIRMKFHILTVLLFQQFVKIL